MGRHRVRQRRRGLLFGIIAAVVAVILVGGVTTAWATGHLTIAFPGAPSATNACGQDAIAVVADPAIAPTVTQVARSLREGPDCVQVQVRSEDSADTASVIAAGGATKADVWLPDSEVWKDRVTATAVSLGRPAPAADFRAAIASTPIVFAAPAAQASTFASQTVGWGSVLGGTVQALLPDPEGSAASLSALGALKAHAPAGDPRALAGAMIALSKTIPRSLDAAMGSAQQATSPTVVVTTEQAVAHENTAAPSDQFFALYPNDGTVALRFPFVRVDGPVNDDKAKDAAIDRFEKALRAAGPTFASAGFRAADGGGELKLPGVVATPVTLLPAVDGAAELELLRGWSVLTLRSRMLAVIDVSGSMEETTESGLRRIDIFQQAAMAAVQKFSGEVELGVWDFSTNRVGTQDWEDLVPIAPLSDAAHSQAIAGVIASLPSRLGGATGLYDTTLAAVQRVREGYDPSKINSVILITDGKNEDDNGISLDDLIAQLSAQNDPKKPVPVILIGFGPDTDLDAMTRIAKATGGAAYTANRPEDLGNVLVDALSQRTCRPNCS